jgi:acetyl-CoA carboxylase carboxyl transferase subunit alpha
LSEVKQAPSGQPWLRVQLARHPKRPHSLDYIQRLITGFQELHGDRGISDDPAIVAGMGFFEGNPIVVVGQQKGRDTKQKLFRNFGMSKPEGYRKAMRIMRMAAKFGRPVLTLLDTPGAYPGVDAEERGQAEAIASCIDVCLSIKVPLVSVIIGEGGSGGAMALAAANTVIMLEHAIYSVISPEGCASILWRDGDKARETAAEELKLTAQDLRQLGVIDQIVPEPVGGAHRRAPEVFQAVGDALEQALDPLVGLDRKTLKARRRQKFLDMGKTGLA